MMKKMSRSLRGHLWKRGITYVLMWCLIMNTSVPTLLALQPGDVTGATGADIGLATWGDHSVINTQNGAVIDWNNFNTTGGQSVTFNQYDVLGGTLNPTSALLNRITSATPTQFDGALNGNGRVFVVNPAGIIFGAGSTVNVAQLVVSGLNITNFDAVATGGALPAFEGGSGTVDSRATVTANNVYMLGKKVVQRGSIFAPNGLVVLAAGENVYLTQQGSNVLVDVSFTTSAQDFYGADTSRDVLNSSLVRSGTVILAAGDTFSRAVSNTGVIATPSGTVTAHAAKVRNAGWINTSAASGSNADGGTVLLDGTEEVRMNLDYVSNPGHIEANGGANGNGGTITLQSQGTVVTVAGTYATARGGTTSGDGGNVKITGEHFQIAGEIDASPMNPTGANGTLEIDPSDVTIANGANAGVVDTIYEQDIEALSNSGTNLVVRAGQSITVQNIVDDLIGGGRGDIELHAPTINFEDTSATDTVSTTTGNIVMAGGAGGINTGHLETGAAGLAATPGTINLSTTDGGDITTRNLTVKGGQGTAAIDVAASGNLTVNGAVAVGADTPIDNSSGGGDAQALVTLKSGDDMALNGGVTADAHATHTGNAVAHIDITSGTNESSTGNLTVGADLAATADADSGTSDALVKVDAWRAIEWVGDAKAVADGDSSTVHVEGRESALDEDGGNKAQIIITEHGPKLEGLPDTASTHMGDPTTGNVLTNDVDPHGGDIDVDTYTQPAHGTVTVDEETGEFTYTPDAGYTGDDTFTYTATNGTDTTAPITVTITMTNDPPTLGEDLASTHMNEAVEGNVLTNDSDTNGDPLSVISDSYDTANGGHVTLNADGTFTYTPADGYTGEDTFTYEATDGQLDGTSNPVVTTGTVTVIVGNALPQPKDDVVTTLISSPVSGNVLANDTDPDLDTLTVVLDGTPPEHGTVTLNTDGTFTYTPDNGYVGQDTFTYEVSDGQSSSQTVKATVTITITAISPVAPGLERKDVEYSGCPALAKWVSKELGVKDTTLDIWMTNALASSRDIQPFVTYERLRNAALILRDDGGAHIAALTQVVNEFATSTAPPTEEQMASIADAIASNAGADNQYGVAEEYLRALAQYINILNSDMGLSMNEAVQFAMANYVHQLTERGNANVTAYITAKLAELKG
jgi:filamentous hemagglutinin family protein